MILPLLAIVVIAGGFALLFQNTSRNSQPLADGTHSARSTSFLGDELSPPKAAPTLSLRNYLGERINIDQYRGKALLVTFLYTHCPEICPLITADLHAALGLMSPKTAARVQIVAVSVDPRGDTPRTVAAFLKVHGMTGRMKYLIGSPRELGHVWQRWGVGSERDAEDPGLHQPLRARLRDRRVGRAEDRLHRLELPAERSRPRRAAAGLAVVRGASYRRRRHCSLRSVSSRSTWRSSHLR